MKTIIHNIFNSQCFFGRMRTTLKYRFQDKPQKVDAPSGQGLRISFIVSGKIAKYYNKYSDYREGTLPITLKAICSLYIGGFGRHCSLQGNCFPTFLDLLQN